MGYALRKGLIVPERRLVHPKRAHVRVPRVDIILRRPFFPIIKPLVAAVSLNATPTSGDTEASAVTTVTVADLTIAAGSNIGLVSVLAIQVGVSAVTCTWNGVSMTSRVSAPDAINNTEIHIFVLRNPPTVNHF